MARKYRATTGINYPGRRGEKRADPGDIVSDLPSTSLDWLLSRGYVERVSDSDEEGDE